MEIEYYSKLELAKGIYLNVKHSNSEQHTFRIIFKDTTCEQVRGANFKNVFSNPNQVDAPIELLAATAATICCANIRDGLRKDVTIPHLCPWNQAMVISGLNPRQ